MKNKLLHTICVFLVSSVYVLSQTPCASGFAEVSTTEKYPCLGYDLLSRIPVTTLANVATGVESNDIWGWTDSTTNKEYALAGTSAGTSFVDITDPVNPILLGTLPTATVNSSWRDIKVYNNYAFIVSEASNHGMQVFDLTRLQNVANPPETFTSDFRYTGVSDCHNIVINESLPYAYLVGCNTYNRGVTILDISNPLLPIDVGGHSADGYTHDAQVVTYNGPDTNYTGSEILIGSNENSVVILDVTNKSNVVKLAEIGYTQIRYTHQGWFTEDQHYFILGDELDEVGNGFNSRTLIFDFSDLTAPFLQTTYYGTTTAIDHNGYIYGNKFFLANYRAGLRVLDIPTLVSTNNTNSEIAYFDTYPDSDSASFNGGAWSIYPYFQSGNIIVNDIANGLFVVGDMSLLSVNSNALNSEFTLSPNPAVVNTVLKATHSKQIETVEVFNILGQKVYFKDNINRPEFVLKLAGNSKGVYLVRINNSITKKLLLE